MARFDKMFKSSGLTGSGSYVLLSDGISQQNYTSGDIACCARAGLPGQSLAVHRTLSSAQIQSCALLCCSPTPHGAPSGYTITFQQLSAFYQHQVVCRRAAGLYLVPKAPRGRVCLDHLTESTLALRWLVIQPSKGFMCQCSRLDTGACGCFLRLAASRSAPSRSRPTQC